MVKERGEGWLVPPNAAKFYGVTDLDDQKWIDTYSAPQPFATLQQTLILDNQAEEPPYSRVFIWASGFTSGPFVQFAEKCRENFRVRWRIITVCFLAVFVMIIFVILDPSIESGSTEIVQYLSTGVLLFGVLFLAGQNLTENRCPACNVWLGRRHWPHQGARHRVRPRRTGHVGRADAVRLRIRAQPEPERRAARPEPGREAAQGAAARTNRARPPAAAAPRRKPG